MNFSAKGVKDDLDLVKGPARVQHDTKIFNGL